MIHHKVKVGLPGANSLPAIINLIRSFGSKFGTPYKQKAPKSNLPSLLLRNLLKKFLLEGLARFFPHKMKARS